MAIENEQTTFPILSQDKDKLKIILRVGLMIFIEFALPIALYYILSIFIHGVKPFLISGAVPSIAIIYGLIRRRRADIIGSLVSNCLTFGALISLFYGNPKIQLLEKFMNMTLLPFHIIAMISLIPIKIGTFKLRPLLFYIFKDLTTGGAFSYLSPKLIDESWDRYWVSFQYFRRGFIFMTVIWGFGLLSEILVRVMIIYNLTPVKMSPEKALAMSNIIHYIWLAKFTLLTLYLVRRMKKQKDKLVADSDKPPE